MVLVVIAGFVYPEGDWMLFHQVDCGNVYETIQVDSLQDICS